MLKNKRSNNETGFVCACCGKRCGQRKSVINNIAAVRRTEENRVLLICFRCLKIISYFSSPEKHKDDFEIVPVSCIVFPGFYSGLAPGLIRMGESSYVDIGGVGKFSSRLFNELRGGE